MADSRERWHGSRNVPDKGEGRGICESKERGVEQEVRIPSWQWLENRLRQDEALDKLEDAVDARNEALKELSKRSVELAERQLALWYRAHLN